MKTGKTKQGLMNALKEIDSITQIDSAYLPGQQITIYGTKVNGRFCRWRAGGKQLKDKLFDSPYEALECLTECRQLSISGVKTLGETVWDLTSDDGTYLSSESFDSIDDALKQLEPETTFRISLFCKKCVSDDFNWSLKESISSLRNGKPFASGKGVNLLTAALNELDHKEEMSNSISVLCMSRTKDHKTWNGLYQTSWIRVDPELPFSVDSNGAPVFQTIDLKLKEEEYKVCLDTQLALYDFSKKDLYPIRSNILTNLSRSLGCGSIFTETTMNGIPLTQANILANCLLSIEKIQLIYRERTEHVKPIIGLAGKNFTMYPQTEFFAEALECCRKHGDCFIESWTVTDAYTSVEVGLTQVTSSYRPYIRIRSSDLPNYPMSISAYAKVGSAKVCICSNSARHTSSFRGKGVSSLFVIESGEKTFSESTLFDEIEKFVSKFRKMEGKNIYLSENWLLDPQKISAPSEEIKLLLKKSWLNSKDGMLTPLMNNLPAKRRNNAVARLRSSSIKAGAYHNAAELFCSIVELVYCALPPVQADKQEILFADLMNRILSACDAD